MSGDSLVAAVVIAASAISSAATAHPSSAGTGTADFKISLVSVQSSVTVGRELRITVGAERLSGDAVTKVQLRVHTDPGTFLAEGRGLDCEGRPPTCEFASGPYGPEDGPYPRGFSVNVYLTFSAPGEHVISADLAVLDAADPNTANNSGAIILTARPSTAGVVAGGLTLSPARPKAGSTFAVSIHVTRGALPVRPTGIACAATVGRRRLTGKGKSARGKATCIFKTPRTARGNVLRGTISFTASAKKVTKRFAVRLG